MFAFSRSAPPRRRTAAATGIAAVTALVLAACGSSKEDSPAVPGTDHSAMPSATAGTPSANGSTPTGSAMPGMDGMAGGDGLADTQDGYRFTSTDTVLPSGRPAPYRFAVTGPDGRTVTAFALDQTMRMHFYAVRSDLTGFRHLHPRMAADGIWTADLPALAAGSWRLFASFTPGSGPGKGTGFVLSRTVAVPGTATAVPLPAAATTARTDGYTVTVAGRLMAGMEHPLTVTVTRGGKPVTDLRPYLGTYAHLTAFHEGDLAFAHLHPTTPATAGDHGGPELSFHARLPTSGNWRLFLQFRTGGTLHTAALTLAVG